MGKHRQRRRVKRLCSQHCNPTMTKEEGSSAQEPVKIVATEGVVDGLLATRDHGVGGGEVATSEETTKGCSKDKGNQGKKKPNTKLPEKWLYCPQMGKVSLVGGH